MTTTALPAEDLRPARSGGREVRLVGLRRSYGDVHALDGLDLTIAPGEMLVLLGPSGCGKTTALRALAGLDDVDAGQVLLDGRDITGVPANRRGMGMVFQSYSLFPHLSVMDNVAFGLRLRGAGRTARHREASEALELVGLAHAGDRFPHELSGGQQQRVALARALAVRPDVLLLDEPLSALDAQVRTQLREEVRRIQLEVGTTTLFVTHDQEEALAVADRVGVMRAGRLEQVGTPEEVYARPASAFVAGFVGLSTQLPARAASGEVYLLGHRLPAVDPSLPDGPVTAFVRPEDVELSELSEVDDGGAGERGARGVVESVTFLGAVRRAGVLLPDGTRLLSTAAPGARPVIAGEQVQVRLLARAVVAH
jgi:putative spermidine/putrescine transport system ATP-binding protein